MDTINHALDLTFQPKQYSPVRVHVDMTAVLPDGCAIQDKTKAEAELRAAVLASVKAAAGEALAAHRDILAAFFGGK